MAKYQFPVGKITLDRYRKERRNTLAKIRRVNKKYGVDLTDEIPTPKLEDFPDRKSFNKWVREVRSFRDRGNFKYQYLKNPYGVVASKKDIKEAEEHVKIAQKNFEDEIEKHKDLPFFQGGYRHGTVGMQPTNMASMNRPPDFDFEKYRQQMSVDQRLETLERQASDDYYDERKEIMRDNFAKVLEDNFNSLAGDLPSEIRSMPAEEFYEMYLMYSEWDFENFYPAHSMSNKMSEQDMMNFHSDVEGKIDKIRHQVDEYNHGEIDDLLTHPNFK